MTETRHCPACGWVHNIDVSCGQDAARRAAEGSGRPSPPMPQLVAILRVAGARACEEEVRKLSVPDADATVVRAIVAGFAGVMAAAIDACR